jgi:hypothetical protein
MITEATTTEDLIATICHARSLRKVSFEEGCCVLDAIAMYDRRCGGGQLGTWRSLNSLGSLPFVSTDTEDERAAHSVVERLVPTVVSWTCEQQGSPSFLFTAWVVIDRATRVTWVECAPLKARREQHPRAAREAAEFPSSSQGTVAAYAFLRTDEPWRAVRDSVLEAYHEARRLLDGKTP